MDNANAAYLIRTISLTRFTKECQGKPLWILFDEYADRVVRAATRKKAIALWAKQFGPLQRITRYEGVHRPSEASMTIADHKTKKPKAVEVQS